MPDTPTPRAGSAPTEPALLPCPWCGNPPLELEIIEPGAKGHVHEAVFRCDECGYSMSDETRDLLVERWNKRTPAHPAAPGELAALAERLKVLSADIGHILEEANYVVCVSGYHPDDRERAHAIYKKLNTRADILHELESVIAILAALRGATFAAGVEAINDLRNGPRKSESYFVGVDPGTVEDAGGNTIAVCRTEDCDSEEDARYNARKIADALCIAVLVRPAPPAGEGE